MISSDEALAAFKKKLPGLQVGFIRPYSETYYLIMATFPDRAKNQNDIPFDDPFYVVNKKTGDVKHFSPAGDLAYFMKVIGS